jgi:hypothetical protein
MKLTLSFLAISLFLVSCSSPGKIADAGKKDMPETNKNFDRPR